MNAFFTTKAFIPFTKLYHPKANSFNTLRYAAKIYIS